MRSAASTIILTIFFALKEIAAIAQEPFKATIQLRTVCACMLFCVCEKGGGGRAGGPGEGVVGRVRAHKRGKSATTIMLSQKNKQSHTHTNAKSAHEARRWTDKNQKRQATNAQTYLES